MEIIRDKEITNNEMLEKCLYKKGVLIKDDDDSIRFLTLEEYEEYLQDEKLYEEHLNFKKRNYPFDELTSLEDFKTRTIKHIEEYGN